MVSSLFFRGVTAVLLSNGNKKQDAPAENPNITSSNSDKDLPEPPHEPTE